MFQALIQGRPETIREFSDEDDDIPHMDGAPSEAEILEKAFPKLKVPKHSGDPTVQLTFDELVEGIGNLSDDTEKQPGEAAVRERLYTLLMETKEMQDDDDD